MTALLILCGCLIGVCVFLAVKYKAAQEEADQARLDIETLITKIVKTYGFKGMFEIDEYICTRS